MSGRREGGVKTPPNIPRQKSGLKWRRDITSVEVLSWFCTAVAGTRYGVPSDEAIAQVAEALNRYTPLTDVAAPSRALEYAKRFCKALSAERMSLMTLYINTPWESAAADKIEAAGLTVESLLDTFDFRARPDTWHDHAIYIDIWARRAWRLTGKCPRSHDPQGPRSAFVAAALSAMGHHQDNDAVSDALRGRYGNRSLHGFELGGKADKKTTQD